MTFEIALVLGILLVALVLFVTEWIRMDLEAVVVLMAPIAFNAATDLGVSPLPFLMTLAMAASASFSSPVSHPANTLSMGPGGYRFVDCLRLGLPLTFLVFVIVVRLVPVLGPFAP